MAIVLNRRGLISTRTALFRVDAGPGIGMGHFMRCRTLAMEMIAQNWVVFFMGYGLPKDMIYCHPFRVCAGINLIEMDQYSDTDFDAKQLLDRLPSYAGCLVVDTYRYSREDFATLQLFNLYRVPVVIIDDIANRDTPAQVVINPNPLFSPEPYQRQKIPHVLCGADYTLIRPEVVAMRQRKYCKEGPIVITLGGGNVVSPLIKLFNALPQNIDNQICVSVSGNCPLEQIEEWVNACPDRRFINTDNSRFPQLLANASIAITGGGTTLWEVYCLGIPSLSLVWVDNQKQTTVVVKEQATSFLIDLVENINHELKSDWLDSGLKSLVSHFGLPCQTRIIQEESFLTNEVISREKTSLVADDNQMIDSSYVSKALHQLASDGDFTAKMVARQQHLLDGMGAQRCVEVINDLTWQNVPLFAADYRRNYENRTI